MIPKESQIGATSKDAVAKLVKAWESKNGQRAVRGSGLGLMAVTLAACGGSSSTTTTTPVAPAPVTPVSAALTIGSDAITGTSANDTISGARVDGIQTWNSADTIAAGAGTDSLTAVITANVQPGAGAVTGVENITVTNANAAGVADLTVTFSTADDTFISGVTSIKNLASSDGLTFARVTELATVSVENTSADGTTTVQFADSVLAGAADTVTLNLNGVLGAVTVGSVTDPNGDYETLTIAASGAASSFAAAGIDGDVTTLNISGSAALTLTGAAFANIATVNAASATGAVSLVLAADGVTGATNTKTITMGAGGDTLDISAIDNATVGAVSVNMGAGNDTVVLAGRAASDYTVVGGAGTDALQVEGTLSAASYAGVSGFETLITNAAADLSLLPTTNSITTVQVRDASAVTNASSGMTLQVHHSTANNDAISLAQLVDGTADTITIAAVSTLSTDLLAEAVSITANDAETVTIVSDSAALVIASADGAADLSITDATSLVVRGDNDVNVGDVASLVLASVDLTGLNDVDSAAGDGTDEGDFVGRFASNANMTITSNSSTSHTGSINVTTGAGNDTITGTANADTISGGAGNDVINGGAGADNITGGDGSDTLTGGAGIDLFNFAVGATGSDTITDFTRNSTGGTADDRIAINIIADDTTSATTIAATVNADAAAVTEENSGGEALTNGEVYVLTGNSFVDVSGNAAADLAAIQAAGGGLTMIASQNALAIFKADTNGDGTADAVQVWHLSSGAAADTTIDSATLIVTLAGYSTTADLAGDFAVGAFDF